MNPYTKSIGCWCHRHAGCHIDKVARFQPAGYFYAWLAWKPSSPKYDTAFYHQQAKSERVPEPDALVCYAKRCAGRDRARAAPDAQELLGWEVPANGNEPERQR